MDRKEFDSLEIEANAHTPCMSTHHIHCVRGRSSQLLIDRIVRENYDMMDEMAEIPVSDRNPINTTL